MSHTTAPNCPHCSIGLELCKPNNMALEPDPLGSVQAALSKLTDCGACGRFADVKLGPGYILIDCSYCGEMDFMGMIC
jgi:hypothetical protein